MNLLVTMADVRAAQLCMKGARQWFTQNGLNWRTFVEEGLAAEVLEQTGDPLALRAVDAARARNQHNVDISPSGETE